MNIAIIGTGYVGLPSGAGFAELGNMVTCIDSDKSKIDKLLAGELTIYEDGLKDMFDKNVRNGRLRFTTSMKEGVEGADLVIIAVGTPPDPVTHQADLKYIHDAAEELALHLRGYTVVATKSTVPVSTGDSIEALISKKNPTADFDVISMPEFLREGYAVHDFFNPDRLIVGTESERAKDVIRKLYSSYEGRSKIIFVKRRSAETIKYASNAFLAVKIHYINEMADFCEKTGADIEEVARGMGLDSRIGPRFLKPGPGYGGSCFPKDTMAMSFMAWQNKVDMTLINAAIAGNSRRRKAMAGRVMAAVKDVREPRIAVWGLAFKEGTDDCRESPAVEIVYELIGAGAHVVAYDPKAMDTARMIFGDHIEYAGSCMEAASGADALAILTEWPEFGNADLKELSSVMKGKNIIDCRNALRREDAEKAGFFYKGIGK